MQFNRGGRLKWRVIGFPPPPSARCTSSLYVGASQDMRGYFRVSSVKMWLENNDIQYCEPTKVALQFNHLLMFTIFGAGFFYFIQICRLGNFCLVQRHVSQISFLGRNPHIQTFLYNDLKWAMKLLQFGLKYWVKDLSWELKFHAVERGRKYMNCCKKCVVNEKQILAPFHFCPRALIKSQGSIKDKELSGRPKTCTDNTLPKTCTDNTLPKTCRDNTLTKTCTTHWWKLVQTTHCRKLVETTHWRKLVQHIGENLYRQHIDENLYNALVKTCTDNTLPKTCRDNTLTKTYTTHWWKLVQTTHWRKLVETTHWRKLIQHIGENLYRQHIDENL
jgi:hypothetical protein